MKQTNKLIFILILTLSFYSCTSKKYHTVKKGDTLSKISNETHISINELKKINHLNSDLIHVGQKLSLSPQKDKKGSYHRVISGDTLSKISNKYGVSVTNLKKINHLKSDLLHIDDKIYLGKIVTKTTNYKKTSKTTYSQKSHSKKVILKNFKAPLKTMIVNSPYGYRDHPVLGRRILHAGVDLKASMNTPIYSAYSGVVTYAGWMNGYGKIIIIDNGSGYETRFAHLNRILVRKGQRIGQGQVIAKSGRTGRVTGPHLHFEIRHNKKTINPMSIY